MTTTHKWTAGAVLLIAVVLAASWFLLISPKRGEASQLQADTESQLNENQSLTTEIQLLKEDSKKLPKYQAQLAEFRDRIPGTSAMPSLIRELSAAADRAGVSMTSISPAAAVPLAALEGGTPPAGVDGALPPEALAGINVDIVVTGGFFEIQQFVNKVENLDRYVQVAGLVIAEEETDAADTAAGTSGGLTATLNSRVYLYPDAVVATTTETQPTETDDE